jgi:hypothetical protein
LANIEYGLGRLALVRTIKNLRGVLLEEAKFKPEAYIAGVIEILEKPTCDRYFCSAPKNRF